MKIRRNKGGAPTKEKKALWKQLHNTNLFNRKSYFYLKIENALDELSPSKAFETFSRLCMIRDSRYIHLIKKELSSFDEDRKNWLFSVLREDSILQKQPDKGYRLKQIKELSFEVYIIYLILFESNEIIDIFNNNKVFQADTDKNFSTYSEIKLKYIFDLYSPKQQDIIISTCFEKEKAENKEFNKLFEESPINSFTEKLIFSILKEHYLIDLKFLNNPDHFFYLPDFNQEEYKESITKTVEDKPNIYSTTTLHSGKNVYLRVNPNKALKHYEEMFKLLQIDLGINTDHHSKTFNSVLAHNTTQKSIAGKMTDLLYIYDNHLYGYSIAWTIEEITRYWRKKKPKYWNNKQNPKTTMSRSTYATYKKIIDNFIGKKHYEL